MLNLIFHFVTAALLIAAGLFPSLSSANNVESSKWFSSSGSPRGVGLVVHGLNLKPSRMDSLSKWLAENGYEALRIKLSGHGEELAKFKSVSRERWKREMLGAWAAVQERARELSVPTYFVGYSLGALMYQDLVAEKKITIAGAQILFAPAIALRPRNKLVNLLKIFGPSFCVPSLSPEAYRSHPCTPLAAYSALFESEKFIRSTGYAANMGRTLVFIDPRDELVSYAGLKKLIQNGSLSGWNLVDVSTQGSTLDKSYHHLIIDEPSVGFAMWEQIKSLMQIELAQAIKSGETNREFF